MSERSWLLSPVLHRARSVWAGHGLDNAASGATECEGDWAPQWCPQPSLSPSSVWKWFCSSLTLLGLGH